MAMKLGLRAVVFAVAVTAPAGVALGQLSGVSHPDEVPVTTSPEGIAQPVVYETSQSSAPPAAAAKVQAAAPIVQPTAQPAEQPVVQAYAVPPAMEPPQISPVSQASVSARRELAANDADADQPGDNTDAGIVTRVPGPSNELPVGAILRIRLRQDLSTVTTAAGTAFSAALVDPMERDGRVLLPAGSTVNGKVTAVHGGKRSSGEASIHLQATSVTLPDGTRYALHAQVIDSSVYHSTRVDDEGTILHKGNSKGTAAVIGLATGSGAAAGAVFGSWPGAIIGGVVGAGISTVVWLRQDRQTELPAGTEVFLGLTGPLAVGN